LAALLLSVCAEHRYSYRDDEYGYHHHDEDDHHHDDDDHHHHKRKFTVVQFVERGEHDVIENSEVNGVGDLDVFSSDVYDVKDKEQVGDLNGFCIQTVKEDRWLCNWEVTFKGDQNDRIYLQGSVWNAAKTISRIAVVGGTGKYSGARGSGTVFSESAGIAISNRYYYKLEFTTQENEEQAKLGVNTPKKFNANHATDYSDANIKKVKVVVDDDDHHKDDDDHHKDDDDHHKDNADHHKNDDDDHKNDDDDHKDNNDHHRRHHKNDDDDHKNDDDDHKDNDDHHRRHHDNDRHHKKYYD